MTAEKRFFLPGTDNRRIFLDVKATQKLEYNDGFRVQLQVITFVTSVKETLFYN